MKILSLQHIEIEDPGHIKTLMQADGCELVTVELDQGERIPDDLRQFDAIFSMGGPMDTWMDAEYPWLAEERNRIKEYVVTLEKPFLGFCLGAQLLGEALGGKVVKSNPPEIGVLDVNMSADSAGDMLFGDFPATIKTLQWHSYEVRGLEDHPQVSVLASSPTTEYQVFRYKQHAYGIQFHIETKKETVSEWGKVPEYEQALTATLGDNALESFDRDVQTHIGDMNKHCKILYEQLKRLVAGNGS